MPSHSYRAVRVTAILIALMFALDAAIARWVPTYSSIASGVVLLVQLVCAGWMSAALARNSRKQGLLVGLLAFVFLVILILYGGLMNCTFLPTGCEL